MEAEKAVAELVHEILHMTYVDKREFFEQSAKDRGWTLEQLVSMSIAGALCEQFAIHYPSDLN